MYSFLGKINGSSFVDVPRDSNFDVIPEKIIEAAKKHLRPIVFLASPNNPTGNLLENSAIEYLATELEKLNSLLVVDEAYAEFARETSIHLVNSHVNLVVVRTFSKWAGSLFFLFLL
jgi:histidinol-phosphate aminotransferase